jgi:translation elongation factor EF-G
VRRIVEAHAGSIADETFAADVTLHVLLPVAESVGFTYAVREATAGQAAIAAVEAS